MTSCKDDIIDRIKRVPVVLGQQIHPGSNGYFRFPPTYSEFGLWVLNRQYNIAKISHRSYIPWLLLKLICPVDTKGIDVGSPVDHMCREGAPS